jgi:fucose permease
MAWFSSSLGTDSQQKLRIMTTDSNRKLQPVAAGCVVRASDMPIVIISFTCFAAFIIYGGSNASLGASVPALSRALGKSESSIGFIFIFRGAGFLTGTLGSAALMTRPSLPLSKEFITCLASVVMGISTFLMSCTGSYHLVLGLSVFQGLGFGGIDCISNCLLPELWGSRIQPWMQALHLCFGIGAMIGPSLVGYFGYVTTYRVLGISAFAPLVALEIYKFYTTAASFAAPAASVTNNSDTAEEFTKEDAASFHRYASTSITEEDEGGADMDSTYAPFSLREGISNGNGKHSPIVPGKELQTMRNSVSNNSIFSADTMETAENDSSKSSQCEDTDSESTYSHPVTFTLRMVILAFYFIYTGIEAGYAGWIPVYVLEEGITTTDSQAAYVSATFWAAMTIGRMLAVFTAMAFSATFMLRFHLVFSAACAVMFMFVEQVGTLQYALTVSALMGLAESAIYALVMTIVSDYGYTM